jgi:hypothetical protein
MKTGGEEERRRGGEEDFFSSVLGMLPCWLMKKRGNSGRSGVGS